MFRYFRDRLEHMRTVRGLAEAGVIENPRARERAVGLLLRCLTPAQRAEFERTRSFKVRGRSGQQYRITYGATANVEVLERGTVSRRLCAGPAGVPVAAAMLAQKLMLETDEAEFLCIAERGPGTTGGEAAFFTSASRRLS